MEEFREGKIMIKEIGRRNNIMDEKKKSESGQRMRIKNGKQMEWNWTENEGKS